MEKNITLSSNESYRLKPRNDHLTSTEQSTTNLYGSSSEKKVNSIKKLNLTVTIMTTATSMITPTENISGINSKDGVIPTKNDYPIEKFSTKDPVGSDTKILRTKNISETSSIFSTQVSSIEPQFSTEQTYQTHKKGDDWKIFVYILLPISTFIILISLIGSIIRKKFHRRNFFQSNDVHLDCNYDSQIIQMLIERKYLLCRKNLDLHGFINEGNYGCVHKAILNIGNNKKEVAVKNLKTGKFW